MARLSNAGSGLKLKQMNAQNASVSNSESETTKTGWEFFKKISGLVTDYLNKQINIPSTSFTPNMVLATKDIFSHIMMAKSFMEQLKEKIETLSNAFSKDESYTAKRKEYVRKVIARSYERRK